MLGDPRGGGLGGGELIGGGGDIGVKMTEGGGGERLKGGKVNGGGGDEPPKGGKTNGGGGGGGGEFTIAGGKGGEFPRQQRTRFWALHDSTEVLSGAITVMVLLQGICSETTKNGRFEINASRKRSLSWSLANWTRRPTAVELMTTQLGPPKGMFMSNRKL